MAVELKLFAKRFSPAVARFAIQNQWFSNSSSENVIQITKFFNNNCLSSNLVQQSQCFSYCCPGNVIQQPIGFNNSSNNLIRPGFLSLLQNCSHSPTLLFRQLDPPNHPNKNQKLLQGRTNALEYLKGLPKSFFFRRKNDNDQKKQKNRIPKLILIQNPFTWLMIKIDFSVLRNIWDPTFQEKEFKLGTKQAISKITNVISEGQYSELNGLLTKPARLSLMRELDRNWSEKQRSLLALKHEDIQISSPRKVYFIRIADKKYCDVDMAFLALKWAPINSIEALIFTEIFARFHREYTPHAIPEWTIAYFKVTRFEVLRRKPKAT